MITLTIPILLNIVLVIFILFGSYFFWKKFSDLKKEKEKDSSSYQKELEILNNDFSGFKEKMEKTYQTVVDEQKATIELYEKYMLNFDMTIKAADDKLNEIDVRGAFKSDDEIGWFFSEVKGIMKNMNAFRLSLIERKGLK